MSELEFSLCCRRVYLCAKSLYKVMWCLDVIASVSLCFYSKFCCFFGRIVCCFVLSSVFCFSVRWLCRSLACRGLIWMLCVCFLSYNVCNVISNDCDCMLSILVQWSICFWRRGIFHYLQLQWLEFHSVCSNAFCIHTSSATSSEYRDGDGIWMWRYPSEWCSAPALVLAFDPAVHDLWFG